MPGIRKTDISGVLLYDLVSNNDERGTLTEIFRQEWANIKPVQWNMVRSAANVLRGVHVHKDHSDYLVVLSGRVVFGLHDLRTSSSTHGVSITVELGSRTLSAIEIPPGVAHGFYFPVEATTFYSLTHYWTGDDLGCRYDDPALKLEWPCQDPILSPFDQKLPDYATLCAAYNSEDETVIAKARLRP